MTLLTLGHFSISARTCSISGPIILQDSEDGDEIYHELVVYKNDLDCDCYELLIKLDEEGHYVGRISYEGVRIGPPKFTIISLSGKADISHTLQLKFLERGTKLLKKERLSLEKRDTLSAELYTLHMHSTLCLLSDTHKFNVKIYH